MSIVRAVEVVTLLLVVLVVASVAFSGGAEIARPCSNWSGLRYGTANDFVRWDCAHLVGKAAGPVPRTHKLTLETGACVVVVACSMRPATLPVVPQVGAVVDMGVVVVVVRPTATVVHPAVPIFCRWLTRCVPLLVNHCPVATPGEAAYDSWRRRRLSPYVARRFCVSQ